jgi:hypothetical protein
VSRPKDRRATTHSRTGPVSTCGNRATSCFVCDAVVPEYSCPAPDIQQLSCSGLNSETAGTQQNHPPFSSFGQPDATRRDGMGAVPSSCSYCNSRVVSLEYCSREGAKNAKTFDISLILRAAYIFICFFVPFVVFVVKTP